MPRIDRSRILANVDDDDLPPVSDAPQVFDFPNSDQGFSDGLTFEHKPGIGMGDMAEVIGQPDRAQADDDEFTRNLVDDLDADYLAKLGEELVADVLSDDAARDPWRTRFKRGMEMMGLINSELDDGPFPGASSAVHPLLTEARVQFWARGMGEIFPTTGPAKAKITGKQTQEKAARAERVAEYLNYEMLDKDEGYYSESSRLLLTTPFQGSAFRKTFRDTLLDTTCGVFVPAEDFIAPPETVDLQTAVRYAHRIYRTPNEIRKLVRAGLYAKVDLTPPTDEDVQEAVKIKDEAQDVDREATTPNRALSRHELFECYVERDLPGYEDKDPEGSKTGIDLPYIITVERDSRKVLSIYRNWRRDDRLKRARVYFDKYDYVPGDQFYGYGLLHLIGGLQEAATGALRVLLDSGATASLSGGFIAKDARMKDDALIFEPGVFKQVETSAEDLNKAFVMPPVKEPSQSLFNLLEFLTTAAQRFTSTTELMAGETSGKNQPVGTTLALLEQGQKVFSAIHRGLHMTLGKELRKRYELAREYVSDEGYPYVYEGEQRVVFAEDFADDVNIIPVSDPNIFSTSQRMAIAQVAYELGSQHPDLIDLRVAMRRVLEAARVPDPEELLKPEAKATPYDPVGEIQAILTGKPVAVLPEQPHLAYLSHHMAFAKNPAYGANEEVLKAVGPSLQAVIGQHLAYAWVNEARKLGVPAPTMDFQSGQVQQPQVPPEAIAQALQAISPQLAQAPGLPVDAEPEKPDNSVAMAQEKLRLQKASNDQTLKHNEDVHQQKMRHTEEQTALGLAESTMEHKQKMTQEQDKQMLESVQMQQQFVNDQQLMQRENTQSLLDAQLAQQASQHEHQLNAQNREAEFQHTQRVRQSDLQHGEQEHMVNLQRGEQAHGQKMQQGEQANQMQMRRQAQRPMGRPNRPGGGGQDGGPQQ